MVNLRWDGKDFRNEEDASGSTADLVSHSGKLQQGYNHGSLTKGLVAYYPMEKGQGEITHEGALDNLGQINGATWKENGQVGSNSLDFNGSSDIVKVNNTSIGNFGSQPFTIAMWLKSRESLSSNGFGSVIATNDTDGDAESWNFNLDDTRGLAFWNNDYTLDMNESLTADTWHFIVIRRNSSNYATASKNLNQFDSGTISTNLSNADNILKIGNNPRGKGFDGEITDFRIYNRALSQPEIQALYNLSQPSGTQVTEKQVPGQNQGGVSRYKLNGNADDVWGSNNGTENGITYETGVYGQASRFQSSNKDYVQTSYNYTDSSTPITLSAWINRNSTGSRHTIIGALNGGGPAIMAEVNNDVFQFYVDDSGSGNAHSVRGETTINSNKWYHVTSVFDNPNNNVRVYVNGKVENSNQSIDASGTITDRNYGIGARPEDDGTETTYFNGLIDDVRIYDTALTPQQVEKLYHKGAYRIPRESTLQ